MDKSYTNAKQLTNSVVSIYLSLAELEKAGKKESQEYQELLAILPLAKANENESYRTFLSKQVHLNANYSVIIV